LKGYTKAKKLDELKGHKMVYVIYPESPEVVAKISLKDVAPVARENLGKLLKKWLKNKVLYIKS